MIYPPSNISSRDEMAQNEFIEMLENIFRGRGYEIITSSLDNSYMLLSREGERTAVGFSPMGVSMTLGEAEMFLSMAENDNANDMLYIHPFRMKKRARAVLKSGDVALWDRTALAIAIGEARIVDLERPEPEKEVVSDRSSGKVDLDPVSELREFEKSIKEETEVTIGPFQVKKVTMGEVETDPDVNVSPEVSSLSERQDEPAPPAEDVPTVSIEAIDMDLPGIFEEGPVREMDVSGVFSMFDVDDTEVGSDTPSLDEPGPIEVEDGKRDEWSDIPLAGQRISGDEAASLAGLDPTPSVRAELRPHILYWVRYVMETADRSKEVAKEKPFLMDCTDGEVMDLPPSLAEELTDLRSGRTSDDKRPIVTSRLDGPQAVENVRRKLLDLSLVRDDKVHDGPGSVIYEETIYSLRKGSLEVVRTSRILMPYWIGAGENDDPVWVVEAHTGRLRHPQ